MWWAIFIALPVVSGDALLRPHPLSNPIASWDAVFLQDPWWSRGFPLPLFLPPHPQVSCVLGFPGPPPALLRRPSLQAMPGAGVWGGGSYCSSYLQCNVPYDCIK